MSWKTFRSSWNIRFVDWTIIFKKIIEIPEGADVTSVKLEDAGNALSDILRQYMSDMGVEDGLQALGYSFEDIPALVKGTIPQVYTVTVA